MDVANLWALDIIGPAILLIVLIWLVVRTRPGRRSRNRENAEKQRRRIRADQR